MREAQGEGVTGVVPCQHCVSWVVVYRAGPLPSILGPSMIGVPLLLPQISWKGPRPSAQLEAGVSRDPPLPLAPWGEPCRSPLSLRPSLLVAEYVGF